MKKLFFTAVPVLAILLLATGCGQKTAGPVNEESKSTPVGEELSGSIPDLLAKGKSIKCDLAAATDVITSGTTYVAGGKFRTDYEMKVADQANVKSYSLSDGTWLYSWSDAYPDQAAKFKLADMEKLSAEIQADNKGSENYNAKMDYKCFDWQADDSIFTLPVGVEFKDYSEVLKQAEAIQKQSGAGAAAGSNVDKATMCKSCDALPSEQAKAGCKKSLGC
jgi:hypothetical protein